MCGRCVLSRSVSVSVAKLATQLAAGVDAYIVPSEDPHQSEYAAACFERRQYISRFTVREHGPFLRVLPVTDHTPRLPRTQGSAGTAVVTSSEALLWTDGRYFLQAETELGSEWRLMRAGVPGTPEVAVYLKTTLPSGARVGIDPQVRMLRRDGWWHAQLLFSNMSPRPDTHAPTSAALRQRGPHAAQHPERRRQGACAAG